MDPDQLASLVNLHPQLPNGARGLNFGLSFNLFPYIYICEQQRLKSDYKDMQGSLSLCCSLMQKVL